ncbi:MAG: tetratricopeptide repeat protein, partial [Arenimonas sp.]|nr:tetratricopeptide repeat protein [Arenimonas sp.]
MSNFIQPLQQQASLLMQQGRVKEAIIAHQNLLKHQPNNVTTLFNLGYLLKTDSQFQASLDAYAKALALGISQPEEVHLNRAVIFSDHLRRDADAERELQRALMLAPNYSPALLNLGNLYEEQGRREQAIDCYQRILRLARDAVDQQQSIYQSALARMTQLCPPKSSSDPLLQQLQMAANTAKSDEDRANLFYTLGRAFDSLGNYDAAFDAFSQANQSVKRSGPTYDRYKTEQTIDALMAAFPSHLSAEDQLNTETQGSPLFICGMFRSGSTLVEQIL